LVLLGIFFLKMFNAWAFFYLALGFLMLTFAHSIDDRKYLYAIPSLIGIIFLNTVKFTLLTPIILVLCFLYEIAKKYPISAFYKGFGYSLLFLLPIGFFNSWYIPISLLASVSEIFHEANHFEQDKKEGRFATAHLLNFKINKEVRKKWKIFLISMGLLMLLWTMFR